MATLELRVATGPKAGQTIVFSTGELIFGRANSVDVVIDWDRSTSSKHFKIESNAGKFVLHDLGSTNGTFVNGTPVTSSQLNHGDKILAGSTIFVVHIPELSEAADSSSSSSSIFDPYAVVTARPKKAKSREAMKPTEKLRRTVSPDVFLHQVRLRIVSEKGKDTIYWIGPGQSLVFGRTDKADCCLDYDPNLSSLHFSVTCYIDHCEIEDLQSRSGTRLNGGNITKARVFNGDELLAGSTKFVIEVEGIDGPVVRSEADALVAPASASPASYKLEAIKSKRASGLVRIRGKLPDPEAVNSIFGALQQHPTFYVIIDFARISLPLPTGIDVDACKLFAWLPAIAAKKTPLLLELSEIPEWKAYVQEAWGSDALVGIQSPLSKQELLVQLYERMTDSSHGPEAARGIVGFCWPSVLESLLDNNQSGFVEKFIACASLIVTEVPGDPESWQSYSNEIPEKFLKTLQVSPVEIDPANQNEQAIAPDKPG